MNYSLSNSLTKSTGGSDADVSAYIAASGATNTTVVRSLTAYLKSEGLWAYSRFFTTKPDQNAGSGATVYCLGGLSSANLTLVNSPTWGTSGVTLAATQYISGTFTALGAADEALIMVRTKPTLASAADTANAVTAGLGNYRTTTPSGTGGWAGGSVTALTAGELTTSLFTLNADVADGLRRLGTTEGSWTAAEDFCRVTQLGNDFAEWKNKTSLSMNRNNIITPTFDCGPTDLGTTSGNVFLGGFSSNGTPAAVGGRGDVVAGLWFGHSAQPTTLQRETITDFINAF